MSSLLVALFPPGRPVRSSSRAAGLPGEDWSHRKTAERSSRRRRDACLRRRPDRSIRPGVESLESRAMLAADDILVSLVGNQVVLTLDPAGTAITNLSTTYASKAGVLTITAVTKWDDLDGGNNSRSHDRSGHRHDRGQPEDGHEVCRHLRGGRRGHRLRHDRPGGGEPRRRHPWRGRQSLSIDTGAGPSDAIVIATPSRRRAPAASASRPRARPTKHGIMLSANVTSPAGSQTFAGSVTLENDVTVMAGKVITFASTVDGDSRLTVSAGGPVAFIGAVGGAEPLAGVTLARAAGVAFNDGFVLDGTAAAAGPTGLLIGRNVNSVVFLPSAGPVDRTIAGFAGAGIRFVGGSRNSLITGVSSVGNGLGMRIGPGVYTGTQIVGNSFSENAGNGITMNAARGITLGGPDANGNTIIFNGGWGLAASGTSTGSRLLENQISDNRPATWPAWAWAAGGGSRGGAGPPGVRSAPGLSVQLSPVGLASLNAGQLGRYAFDLAIDINGVQLGSTGALDTAKRLVDIDAIGGRRLATVAVPSAQTTEFRRIGSTIYVDAQQLGATGLPWVSVTGSSAAAVAVTSLVAGLTPAATLQALEFPISSQAAGGDAFGTRYSATIGTSSFAALLPLADLTPLDASPCSATTRCRWTCGSTRRARSAGSRSQVASVGTITLSLTNYGQAVRVAGTGEVADRRHRLGLGPGTLR